MAQPVTAKTSADGGDRHVRYGASSMQGWRKGQEDAHITRFGLGGADFATAPAAASGATGGGGGMMDMDFSMLGSPPKAGAAGQSDQVLNSTMVCTLASRVLHPSRLARTPRTSARTRA